ncbi:mercury resistance protein [Candidatus Uhrbacteria bacterium]|nr:mercury resistance protein [Candidatus Uhrbacteria bacterium]
MNIKIFKNALAWTFAVMTCPCHLFILAALLAGSAAGAFVKSYFIPLFIVFSILFFISLSKALETK